MRGFFWQDVRRSFCNVGFLAALTTLTALFLTAVVMGAPLNRTRSTYYIMTNAFAASGFGPFAAVFPVLAYASRFCEEYQSGYYRMICARMSPGTFGIIRMTSVALSGGVIIAAPILMVCIMALRFGIPGIPHDSDEGLWQGTVMLTYIREYGDWYIVVGKVLLGFLFGCIWSLVGLAFAAWVLNRYVALIAPFVLYESLWLGLEKIPLLNPIRLLRGDDLNSYPLSIAMESLWLLAVCVIVLVGLNRRCRNA